MENTNLITKVNDGLCAVEKTITWIAFSIMLALLVVQVVCRYCFNWPLAWAEEMVRYTYIAVSFIGATIAVREKSHICIDILPIVLERIIKNKRIRLLVLNFFDVLACLLSVVLWCVVSKWVIEYNFEIGKMNQITTCNEWPMWLMCLPMTVSCIMMGVHSALNAVETLIEVRLVKKEGVA